LKLPSIVEGRLWGVIGRLWEFSGFAAGQTAMLTHAAERGKSGLCELPDKQRKE